MGEGVGASIIGRKEGRGKEGEENKRKEERMQRPE